ncbi:MAG: hypothetical protein CFE32_11370 [Alphaproteobacteria bacterium PA3]|nr:MAG: hypothetical protein CFE32_11370 [Alphaproteobacteria bacterium PA3]
MRERFVALLPLTHSVDFADDQILARLTGLFPSLMSKLRVVRAGGFKEGGEGGPCFLAVGPNVISVHLHPGPPRLETSDSLDTVCPAWFGVRANHPKIHSHVVVRSEQDANHPAEALAAAAAVSMVAAALISVVPVEEIIWKTGQVSIEPQAFQRAALRLTIPEIKVGHWLAWRSFEGPVSPQNRPSLIYRSKGLAPFFGRELETVASILPLAEIEKRVMAVTDFLILHGPPVFDDMPLYVPDHDYVRVRLRDRGFMDPDPVLLLRIEAGPTPAAGPRYAQVQSSSGGFGKRALT